MLSVSLLCVDLADVTGQIELSCRSGLSRLHLDFVDGTYGQPGLPFSFVDDLYEQVPIPMDAHVMMCAPGAVAQELASRGCRSIVVPQEAIGSDDVEYLRSLAEDGVTVGLAVPPGSRVHVDLLLTLGARRLTVMTVHPGGSGRPFQRQAFTTLAEARTLRQRGLVDEIEVDGGVGSATIGELRASGATSFVLGSTAFPYRTVDPERVEGLRAEITRAERLIR